MMNRAMGGAATEENSKMKADQVTALVKACWGTMWGRMAERAGRLKVEKTPPAKMIQNMVMVAEWGPILPCAKERESTASAIEQMAAVSWPRAARVRRLWGSDR